LFLFLLLCLSLHSSPSLWGCLPVPSVFSFSSLSVSRLSWSYPFCFFQDVIVPPQYFIACTVSPSPGVWFSTIRFSLLSSSCMDCSLARTYLYPWLSPCILCWWRWHPHFNIYLGSSLRCSDCPNCT
jgi:hypothetical protein